MQPLQMLNIPLLKSIEQQTNKPPPPQNKKKVHQFRIGSKKNTVANWSNIRNSANLAKVLAHMATEQLMSTGGQESVSEVISRRRHLQQRTDGLLV